MRNSGIIPPPLGTPLNRSHPLTKGLVGYWPFNEGGGQKAFDSTGLVNTPGVLTNGAVFKQSTRGNCVSFDGTNDYISIGNTSTFSFIQNTLVFTIAAWIKLGSNTASQAIMGSAAATTDKGFYFYYSNDGGSDGSKSLNIDILRASSGNHVVYARTVNNLITDSNWHHVVLKSTAAAGSSIFFYLDGFLIFDATIYNVPFTSLSTGAATRNPLIGAINHSTIVDYFNGLINDFRVYNRALTDSEIGQIYASPYSMFQNRRPLNLTV